MLALSRELKCPVIDLSQTLDPTCEEFGVFSRV